MGVLIGITAWIMLVRPILKNGFDSTDADDMNKKQTIIPIIITKFFVVMLRIIPESDRSIIVIFYYS